MYIILNIVIIAFMCSINVSAQNVIKGTVTDGNDEPLPRFLWL